MVDKAPGPRGNTISHRRGSTRIPRIPMEWMDPMSWRLPSGMDLAEFALQAGFLAPLMLGRPAWKKKKVAAQAPPEIAAERAREGPDRSGSFRGSR